MKKWVSKGVILCMYICLCVCVCVVCVWMCSFICIGRSRCVHMQARGQHLVKCSPLLFETSLSLNQEHINSARLAGQQTPRFLLSRWTATQATHVHHPASLTWMLEIQAQVLILAHQTLRWPIHLPSPQGDVFTVFASSCSFLTFLNNAAPILFITCDCCCSEGLRYLEAAMWLSSYLAVTCWLLT